MKDASIYSTITQDIRIIYTKNGWTLEVIDNDNLLNHNITEQLKKINEPIYFSEITFKYWMFDFKINDVWFEALNIDCCNMTMTLNAYN